MSFSLNEVEATSKKATRGAGYSWGLAEESGKIARWLCAQGLDGCGILASFLEEFDGSDPVRRSPAELGGEWSAADKLCTITAGAALADSANRLKSGEIKMISVTQPAILLQFSAIAARKLQENVTVDMGDCVACTDGNSLSLSGELPGHADLVSVRIGGGLGTPTGSTTRGAPAADVWATLNKFAHRTYAPATEESRLLGAGAGTTDND